MNRSAMTEMPSGEFVNQSLILYTTERFCTKCALTHIECRLVYESKRTRKPEGRMMKTATAYIRVSTEGQVTDGVSMEAQQAKIAAWCLANDVAPGNVFIDAGISGKRADNRPQLQLALDDVCRKGGVLVVYSLSRLARSTKDTIAISERLDRAGADLVSLSEKLDTTSAAGKMVFRMMAVLAEFERDQVSERTTAAMAHKKSKGERVGKIPFGYTLAADGVSLLANADELRAVELIRSLNSQGYSLRAIAAELDAQKIPTKDGKGSWQHTTVKSILARV